MYKLLLSLFLIAASERTSSAADAYATTRTTQDLRSNASGPIVPIALMNGLKGYWKLDEQSGTRFDATGHHFDLSVISNVEFQPEGILNGCAFFPDGGDNGLTTQGAKAQRGLAFSGDWTVSAWANGSSAHPYGGDNLFAKSGEVYFWRNWDNTMTVHVMSGTDPENVILASHTFNYVLPENEWHHLIVRRVQNQIDLFVDGHLRETTPVIGAVRNNHTDFIIGMQKDGWPWHGGIDEVGYWGRGLNAGEIAALYGNGRPLPFVSFVRLKSGLLLRSGKPTSPPTYSWHFIPVL